MMKPLCTALAALLLASFAHAADPAVCEWRADLSTTEVMNFYLRHGDFATITAHLYLRGQPYSPTNAVCRYGVGGGVDSATNDVPCSVSENTITAFWTPILEQPGVSIYPLIFRIEGRAYRAAAMVHLRASPGPDPDVAPFILDFATVTPTNAPWALESVFSSHANDMTNHVTAAEREAWNGYRASIAAAALAATNYTAAAAVAATNYTDAAAIAATNYTDAAALAATNYTDAAVRSLPAVTNVTVGGVPLAGLVPEYVVARETDRRAAYTAASHDDTLRDGKLILLYMAAQPSAAWTLNLTLADGSTTGAKPVRFWGTATVTTHYAAGSILPLVYRAGAWYVSDRDTNNDTYDRVRVNTYVRFSAQTTKYAICCGTTNGYRKVAPGIVFDSSMPVLYANVNATSAAGAQNNNFYASMPNVDVRNTVAGFASRRGKPLYLVGTLAADGRTFTVGDPALSYEASPPCIPLGLFNNNADNQLYFLPGPLIRETVSPAGVAAAVAAATNAVGRIVSDDTATVLAVHDDGTATLTAPGDALGPPVLVFEDFSDDSRAGFDGYTATVPLKGPFTTAQGWTGYVEETAPDPEDMEGFLSGHAICDPATGGALVMLWYDGNDYAAVEGLDTAAPTVRLFGLNPGGSLSVVRARLPASERVLTTGSGVPDMGAVSNAVSGLLAATVAELPAESTLEVLRLAVADLWDAVGRLSDLSLYDDVSDAIGSLVAASLTNYVARAELAALVPASRTVNGRSLAANVTLSAADVGALPAAGYSAISPANLGQSPFVYVEFSAVERVLNYTGSGTLDVGGVHAPNGPPCHLVLAGFSSVSWPDDTAIDGSYDPAKTNYYEIGAVNGQSYVRHLFAR